MKRGNENNMNQGTQGTQNVAGAGGTGKPYPAPGNMQNIQNINGMPMYMGGMQPQRFDGMQQAGAPMQQMPPSWGFNMSAAAAAAEEAAAEEARNVRGGYKCSKCGLPKKGHVCAYQPKLRRRDDEDPIEKCDMSCQVEVDPNMTVRELNLSLQGTAESYPHLMLKEFGSDSIPNSASNSGLNTPNNQFSPQSSGQHSGSLLGPSPQNSGTYAYPPQHMNINGQQNAFFPQQPPPPHQQQPHQQQPPHQQQQPPHQQQPPPPHHQKQQYIQQAMPHN